MAEQNTPQQESETQRKISELREKFGLTNFDLVKEASRVRSDFRWKSSAHKEETRERLLKRFKESGFLNMTRDEIILFMEQYRRGQFVFEHSEQDRKNIAEMIAALPETKNTQIISHGKFNPLVAFNRFRRNTAINFAAKKLRRIQAKSDLEKAAIYYKYHGSDIDAAEKKAQDPNYVSVDEAYREALSNVGFFRRQWTKLKYGNPSSTKYREFKVGKNSSAVSYGIDKDYYDNVGGFKGWVTELREKYWMRDAPISLLQERRKDIEIKIAELHAQMAAGESKSASKKSNRQLRRLTRLLATVDSSEKQRNLELSNKLAAVDKKYSPKAKTQQENIARRFEIIQQKTDILDYSTTRGRYLYALLQKTPATQRKDLEAIVLERKKQEFSSEKDFLDYVKEQFQAGNFNKKDVLLQTIAKAVAKEEGRSWATRAEKNDNANDQNSEPINESQEPSRVNEGHSAPPPPAPTPSPEVDEEWQTRSEQILKTAYEPEIYELITPEREGENADNEQVLYQTFKNKEDEHTVTVEKTTENDYNLSAKDKEGKDSVPSVEDMKATMEAIKQDGHKTLELGEVKTPEFLARAVAAAEESGIEITNLKEVKERLSNSMGQEQFEQRYSQDHRRETEKRQVEAIERSGFTKDLDVKEGTKVDKTVRGLNALAAVSKMSSKEYDEYKKTDDFKSQKLTKNQVKILDGIKKLQQEEKDGKITSKDKRYIRTLSRMIEDYQTIGNRYSGNKKKQEVARRAFARGVVQRATIQQKQGGR